MLFSQRCLMVVFATVMMLISSHAWGQESWSSPVQTARQTGAVRSEPVCDGFAPCDNYIPYGSQCGDAWSSRWLDGYAGVYYSAGGGLGAIDRAVGDDFTIDNCGSHVGGLLGYNFGCSPTSPCSGWLWGAELELTGLSGAATKNDATFGDVRIDGNWMTSLQFRGGYAWKNTFLFASTGVALSDINVMASTDNHDSVRAGWAFGVGIEHQINPSWSTRIDAVGYGFGSENVDLGGSTREVGIGAGQLRIGIIKRF